MTEQQVKDKVRAVLALMKPEWKCCAFDKGGLWFAYNVLPIAGDSMWSIPDGKDNSSCWLDDFELPPYPGDWRESLVER